MFASLLAVTIGGILWGLFILVIVVAVLAAIWYAFDYIASTWNLPPIAVRVGHTVLVLAMVGILILALLSIINPGFIQW